MKTKILSIAAVISILFFSGTGCFLNTKENINKLSDKKFYFSEFEFVLLGQTKDEAYIFFKKFPVKKIMFMLASEYNISVDMSDYNNFINTKNLSDIKTDGMLRSAKQTWAKKSIVNNRIGIVFEQDYFDASKIKFGIKIYNGNSTLKIINTEISEINSIFSLLKSQLPSGKDSFKEYEEKNYDKITPIPFIIETNEGSCVVEQPADLKKIKSMIDEYVKPLNQDEKNIFKHEIIDFIYQKCN